MRLEDISIREILTSNSEKCIEVTIRTKKGSVKSSVPTGKNGIYKNRQITSGEAIKKFLDIKRHFLNNTFEDIQEVDQFLRSIDISPDFREIGGNLAFAISSSFLKSFAQWNDMEIYEYLSKNKYYFPTPIVVMTNREKSQTDFREYLLYPVKQKSFADSINKLLSIYKDVNTNFQKEKNLTMSKILKTLSSTTTSHALQIGLNMNATELWNTRRYTYSTSENLTPQEQILFVQDMAINYPIGYIEDPFHEEDIVLHSTLTHRLPTRIVAGNNLYSNNIERIMNGLELKATSGIVLTPSEMGTVSNFINTVGQAKKRKVSVIIGTPENDTDDMLVCHLALGTGCENMKFDLSKDQSGRINEMIRIEEN